MFERHEYVHMVAVFRCRVPSLQRRFGAQITAAAAPTPKETSSLFVLCDFFRTKKRWKHKNAFWQKISAI